ncbi:aspartic proteinase 36-like isoform X2 [Rutidosis leptorrhynchoides]|uniref:aspartic proteinase 36-like isoform X2 n=1 Tax=Rutidosis leptorrhynchoides TaxID=125765 RepID=UPI003A995428
MILTVTGEFSPPLTSLSAVTTVPSPPRYIILRFESGLHQRVIMYKLIQEVISYGLIVVDVNYVQKKIPLSVYDPMLSTSSKIITCDQDFCAAVVNPANNDCIMGTQCSYYVRYGDDSSTKGYFVRDYVQLDRVSGNLQTANMNGSITFGCGTRQGKGLGSSQQALDGILGLGQSNSSIISQLAMAKKVKKTFSHCLSGSKGGIFAIGEVVHPKVNTTPIMPNDKSHYNIELMAIEVGDEFLRLPTNLFNTASKRGAIVDSGTTLAYFPDELYNQLLNMILNAHPDAKLYTVDRNFTCFKYRGNVNDGFPIVTFHFANSLKLKVYPHQYLFKYQNQKWCIGFQSTRFDQPAEVKDVTLLGDIVLKDRLVTYNMEDQTIGWTEYDCSSSIQVKDEESGMVYKVGSHDMSLAGHTRGSFFMWFWFIIVTKMVMY